MIDTGTRIETLEDALKAVAQVAPVARAHAQKSEDGRQLAAEVVDAIAEANLWGVFAPRAVGGSGLAGMSEQFEVVRAMAYEDSSAGWGMFICAGSPMLVGSRLGEQGRDEVFAHGIQPMSGTFQPGGTGRVVDGGFVVSGTWPFTSGVSYAGWAMANVFVTEADGSLRMGRSELPEFRSIVIPAHETTIIDDWHVAGLRGTGSMSFTVDDVMVPDHRTFLFLGEPSVDERKYSLPLFSLIAPGFAAMAIGIAQRAIDEVIGLLPARVGPPTFIPASEDAVTQSMLGKAIASVRAAAESTRSLTARYDSRLSRGDDLRELPFAERIELRQHIVWAAETCQNAVNEMFRLGGASSIYEPGVLQRAWRDINVLMQHIFLRAANHEVAGKVALGLEVDSFFV